MFLTKRLHIKEAAVALGLGLSLSAAPAYAVDSTTPSTLPTVDNVKEGIVLNLFDYDATSKPPLTPGYTRTSIDQREGINTYFSWFGFVRSNDTFNNTNGYYVPFGYTASTPELDSWYTAHPEAKSDWRIDFRKAGVSEARQPFYHNDAKYGWGIVQNKLGADGYPVLAEKFGGESLAPLFNTKKTDYIGRTATYTGASHLFTRDANGYQFNSSNNYAYFNKDTNNFEVYSSTYKATRNLSHRAWDKPVGFFPFDKYDPTNADIERFLGEGLNHHFGLSMSSTFMFPKDATTDPANYKPTYLGKPMTFNFSGDDDAWVFIDGVLVLDIGGLHNIEKGTIDFTNDLVILPDNAAPRHDKPSYAETHKKISDIMREAGVDYDMSPGSVHTIQLFYLERGDIASNLAITNFNVPTVKDVNVEKLWKDASAAPKHEDIKVYLLADGQRVKDANGQDISLVLNEANGWKASFENVLIEKLDEGGNVVPIEYSVEEDVPENYTSDVEDLGFKVEGTEVSDNFAVTNTEKTYSADYEFVSGTEGKELPQEILDITPAKVTELANGEELTAETPSFTTIDVDGGSWTFVFWDADKKTVDGADLHFVGTWAYTAKEEPVKPEDPTKPEDSSSPEEPKQTENKEKKAIKVAKKTKAKLPQTGDVAGIATLATAAAAGVSLALAKYSRKK